MRAGEGGVHEEEAEDGGERDEEDVQLGYTCF